VRGGGAPPHCGVGPNLLGQKSFYYYYYHYHFIFILTIVIIVQIGEEADGERGGAPPHCRAGPHTLETMSSSTMTKTATAPSRAPELSPIPKIRTSIQNKKGPCKF
jgi:hypothetical protein